METDLSGAADAGVYGVVRLRVVIVGAGEVGSSIAASLADTHDVVVVDQDPARVDELTYDVDVLALQGDGTDIETLQEAGIGESDLVIASTDDDRTNIVVCGTAKVCCDAFTIGRVKHPRYLRTWEGSEGAFGVDFMVCTDLLAAEVIVGVIGLPTAQDVDMFADGTIQMTEFEIPEDSPVADQTVREADRFDELTFAAVIREEGIVIPSGETVIGPGDDVVVIGSPESAREFSAAIAPEESQPTDAVIVGGGEIGYQVARLLEERGFRPKLVERDADRARWLAENLPKTTVLQSDATDRAFLERENVGMADVVIAALDNDQQNLLATLLAKRIGADRAVAIVETIAFTDLFEAVGVDVAVSPREATAEEIIRFTRASRAENVSLIEGDRAEVMELEVLEESSAIGETIQDLARRLPEGVVVGAISRAGELITPRGDTVVTTGDHVVIFADAAAIDAVNDVV
jgi:trk system potassium uptake protein TrkA